MKKIVLIVIISAFSFAIGFYVGDNKNLDLKSIQLQTENNCPYLNTKPSLSTENECPYLNENKDTENKCPYSEGEIKKSDNNSKKIKSV